MTAGRPRDQKHPALGRSVQVVDVVGVRNSIPRWKRATPSRGQLRLYAVDAALGDRLALVAPGSAHVARLGPLWARTRPGPGRSRPPCRPPRRQAPGATAGDPTCLALPPLPPLRARPESEGLPTRRPSMFFIDADRTFDDTSASKWQFAGGGQGHSEIYGVFLIDAPATLGSPPIGLGGLVSCDPAYFVRCFVQLVD